MRCLRLRMTWRSTRADAGGKAVTLRPYPPLVPPCPFLWPAAADRRTGKEGKRCCIHLGVVSGLPLLLLYRRIYYKETNRKTQARAFVPTRGRCALYQVIGAGAACHHRGIQYTAEHTAGTVRNMESAAKMSSRSVCCTFGGPMLIVLVGSAVVLLQLSLVRCDTDWTEFKPKACRAAVSGGGRTPGKCVPLTWCPPLVAAAGRGRRPRPCGFHDTSVLVCCPSADVVNPTTPNTGCGAVVDDPGAVTSGPNGGVRLARSTWPWMAAIFKGDKFLCGGSLLDGDTVLTAAHCFPDFRNDAGMYKVRVGILEVNETVSSHSANLPVVWIRLHERYRTDRHYNDIALVKTASKAPYGTHIGPVCLPQPDLKLGGQVVVLGWGHTAFGGRYAHRLQEGRVSVISNEECDEIMRKSSSYWAATPDGITEDFVCAVNHTGVDACQGDSGGPLLALGLDFRWNVVGVVSFGIGCGGRFPGAYTRVTTFLEWIARNRD